MLKITGGMTMPQKEIIPTPSFGINHVLGGGFWTGRFHLMWGNYSSGKTTFLLHTLANAQSMGYTPVIVDSENSYTDEWGARCGIDLDQRIWMKSNMTEHIWKELKAMMGSNIKFAFLIDSINAIQSEDYFDDRGGLAPGARSRNKLLTLLSEFTHPEKNIVFAVAQQTNNLGAHGAPTVAKTGNAENHISTNIIRLFASNSKDNLERANDDTILNRNVRWTMQKCKQAPIEGVSGHYWFSPQTAHIDTALEIIDIAVYNGIIERAGAWFKYRGEKFQGMANLRNEVDIVSLLEDLDNNNLKINESASDDE